MFETMLICRRRLAGLGTGAAFALMWLASFSAHAQSVSYGAFGFLDTIASGGTQVTHTTSAQEQRLADGYSAGTQGSKGSRADAAYHGSLAAGSLGTFSLSQSPGLDNSEATARASTSIQVFDTLTFTLPPGEYPDDVYAVLHGDYDGYLSAIGNYGTTASQTIRVDFGAERFSEYFVDHGDIGNDGFYSAEITLAAKLLNGGQTLTIPRETNQQVIAYLYAFADTPAYVDASPETAESDFASSLRILSIDVPTGVTWTSASGVFLSVPEPRRGCLLLAGIGGLIVLGRVRSGRRPFRAAAA